MDSLFQSFNQQVSMNNFAELSGCVFSWIEERCKPGDLQVSCLSNNLKISPENPNYSDLKVISLLFHQYNISGLDESDFENEW